jgi:single-stranded DNA-specific DHH superfamily exonuclease
MKNNLLVSGTTNEMVDWNIDEIINTKSRKQDRDRMVDYDWENKIARNGMTYLEIEQFNNTYNR